MVKLRLTRIGKRHQPHYRIIAIQARTKRDGKALEYLGYYNPRTNPTTTKVKKERIEYWLDNGAQPTRTVQNILVKEGILEGSKEKKVYTKAPGRKKQEREAAKAEKAAAAEEAKKAPKVESDKSEEKAE